MASPSLILRDSIIFATILRAIVGVLSTVLFVASICLTGAGAVIATVVFPCFFSPIVVTPYQILVVVAFES